VLHNAAGTLVPAGSIDAIRPGATTRQELLDRLGPPTGIFDTNLIAVLASAGSLPDQPGTPGRIDDDVLTWHHVDVDAQVAFFPVLFLWTTARVRNQTLTVFFDERGLVEHAAWREDGP
jgi:hypothetical protein